ncbi:MAG: N-acetylmuramoyl-L-alanine amidase [Anaerolineae bacterium]|nr:N-acetylmuramoyl-L-alanine amidase [Anaerolineae bacterium]
MVKWFKWVRVGLCGVLCALLVGCLGGPEATPTPAGAPKPETDVQRWVQTSVADFQPGQLEDVAIADTAGGELRLTPLAASGVYTSAVFSADFSFTAVVAHWNADLPPGSELEVEMRYETAAGGWSPWYLLPNVEWVPEINGFYPEAPLLLTNGLKFQYRAILRASSEGDSPRLNEITMTCLDTSAGPTTIQAQSAVKTQSMTPQGVPGPTIITRGGWGADEAYLNWTPEYRTVSKIVVHHTVTPNNYDESQGAAWVRAIYYYHAVTLGWGDIGYNYLVDQYGNLYEGRYGGPGTVGGHVYGYNYGTVGISAIGTYGNSTGSIAPTAKTMSALTELVAWESSRSLIHPLQKTFFRDAVIANLGGHRDYPPYSTSCPGDLLYAQLDALRLSTFERIKAYIPQYDVAWLAWEGQPDTTLQTGQIYAVQMQIRNVGWFTWPAGGNNPVRVGYHWLDQGGQPVVQPAEDDHRTALETDLAFGEVGNLSTVQLTTPRTPGVYTLVWDMVHEGVVWFHDANPSSAVLRVQVTVGDPPTATPSPMPDLALVQNGGFEYDGAWTIYETAYPAQYVDQTARSGRRALQTGIAQAGGNVYTYSSAEQTLILPAAGPLLLSYWYRTQISDDYAYVYLRVQNGNWQALRIVRNSVADWTQGQHDLSAYAGQSVTLRFGTYNDGRGDVSAMYVDDVSIQTGAISTPAPPPTPIPTATSTATSTPTPSPTPTTTPLPTATSTATSTPTPSPLPTATSTATSTPTPSPTPTTTPLPTATSTATSTPTPVSPACSELAVNRDFERDDGWTISNTPHKAHYSTDMARTGTRSMQLGITDLAQNQFSYSSADQRFVVPVGQKVTLDFWYRMPNSGGSGDYGYFLLQPDGGSWRTLRIVNERVTGWTQLQVDVSHYAGSAFTLRLGVRNDGGSDSAAAVMYVDSLSVQACRP